MKFLFLVNDAAFLFEFLGKIAHQFIKEGDECSIVLGSKLAEYERAKFFPKGAKFLSKVDWCIKNYDPSRQEFGALSWRELYTVYERFNLFSYGYKESLDVVNQLYQFFDHVFETEKPDIVIGEPPAGLFGQVAYYFLKKNNIPFCGIAESRFPGRIEIWDLEWTCTKFEKDFNSQKKEDFLPEQVSFAKDFIKKFISHETIYSSYFLVKVRFTVLSYLKHYSRRAMELKGTILKYYSQRKLFKKFDYESESAFKLTLKAPFKTIKRNIRIKLQKNMFDKIHQKDQYLFFPIQYEPEASTLVLASYYSNQLATIKYAAMTLPFPYKLYLKEHPGSIGTRKNAFYQEIKKIPNAVLLSSEESTPQLVKNSMGIITMTSTVGMEAAMAGKPVYVLGNVLYNHHPFCRKVVSFQDLSEKVKKDLKIKPDASNLEEDNMRFIISLSRNSILANIFYAQDQDDKNDYQQICRDIKKQVANNSHG